MSSSITNRRGPGGDGAEDGTENDSGTGTLSAGFQKTLDLYEELQNATVPTNDTLFQVCLFVETVYELATN